MKTAFTLSFILFALVASAQEKPLTPAQLNYRALVNLPLSAWLLLIEQTDSKKLADSIRQQVIPQFQFMDKYRTDKVFRDSIDKNSKSLKDKK